MKQETREDLIIEQEVDEQGNLVKSVKRSDGNTIFSVSASFTEEQVREVIELVEAAFNSGMQFGISRVQADLKRVIGIREVQEQEIAQEVQEAE